MAVTHNSRWGARIGPRIAMLVSQSIVYTHHKLHALKHRLAMAVFHSISDEISVEVDETIGPFLAMLKEAVPEDHAAYPAVKFMHERHGQLKAIAGTGLQMTGLLGAFSSVVNNELAAIVYNIIKANPGQLPDPSTVVQAYATQLIDLAEAQGAIGAQGIQYGWADRMLALGFSPPALGEILEMLRRGQIITEDAEQMLWRNGVRSDDATKLVKLAQLPISVADAALAVLRGNMTQAEGEKVASENGIDTAGFAVLIGNTGEPPGLMQLLEGFRRGFIDKATLEKGIKESRYRNEWIPLLEQLRYEPMSVSDAVRATVQNQMPQAEAEKIADENGLQPGHFGILVNTEGNPLSRTEMAELYNRGLATEEQFKQAIRESRYKNKYVDLAFNLTQAVPPMETVLRALRYGAITHDDAVKVAVEHGYSAKDAAMLIAAGSGERTQVFKNRVVSSVVTLYEDGVLSAADLTSNLKSLGFSDTETTFITKSADFHRESRVIGTVVTAVRGKYLGHHISESVASGLLDKIGIPSDQRDYLLKTWKIEIGAFTRLLTPAQIVKAAKMSLITEEDAASRLVDQGYSEGDATLLLGGA